MRNKSRGSIGAAGRLSSVGLELGFSIVGCLLGGWYLDRWLGSEPWLAIGGLVLGTVAGFRALLTTISLCEAEVDRESPEC